MIERRGNFIIILFGNYDFYEMEGGNLSMCVEN